MDHVGHRADAVERVEAVDGLRAVRHADRDAVTLLDAERHVGFRGGVNLLHEFRVRRFFAHELVGVVLGVFVGGGLYHLIDGFLRVFEMLRRVAVVFEPGSGRGNAHWLFILSYCIHTCAFCAPPLYRKRPEKAI